jgi:ATP-dependent RNA helicase RhlE
MPFAALGLAPELVRAVKDEGYTEPTPIQRETIPLALDGRDVVGSAQTGTGKTAAFVLPILQRLSGGPSHKLRALILVPTRELCEQVLERVNAYGRHMQLKAAAVYGGVGFEPQTKALSKGVDIIVATPGRLLDHMGRGHVDYKALEVLVLDEADRMLDMGFLPTVKRILAALPAQRQTLLFSATIESSVKHLVETQVRNAIRIEVGSTTQPAEKVDLHLYEVEPDRKLGLLQSMLREEDGSFLVFARTKHGADRLSKRLAQDGVKSATIHGNRSQNQRNQALRGFQEGSYRVLVATDVAARGIHVEGIAHVVNYDLPQVPEDFIHRVGRTGRAGARGTASTFASRSERSEVARIERTLNTQLVRRGVSADIARDERAPAPVIPIAPAFGRSTPRVRSFAPRVRRRFV